MNINDKKYIVIDIDGTIANIPEERKIMLEKLNKQNNPNWFKFYDLDFENDEPRDEIIEILRGKRDKFRFIFCTSRRFSLYEQTMNWIKKYILFDKMQDMLLMRDNWDASPNHNFKIRTLARKEINPNNTLFCIDDEIENIKAFKEVGFTTVQV